MRVELGKYVIEGTRIRVKCKMVVHECCMQSRMGGVKISLSRPCIYNTSIHNKISMLTYQTNVQNQF